MGYYDRNRIQDARAVSAFSTRVYGWMAGGLAFTAAVAFFIFQSGLYIPLASFWWVWGFLAFGVAMGINVGLNRFSLPTIVGLFLAYAGIEGVLFGTILPAFASAYGGQVIWTAFLTASSIFGLAMGYGIFTKNDLTGLGKILQFALIGLIGITFLYLILSFFMNVTWASLFISYLGLIIFVGLTAYDAQTIRQMSMQADINSVASYRLSMVMALRMYINMVMIFWYLLQILSSNRK